MLINTALQKPLTWRIPLIRVLCAVLLSGGCAGAGYYAVEERSRTLQQQLSHTRASAIVLLSPTETLPDVLLPSTDFSLPVPGGFQPGQWPDRQSRQQQTGQAVKVASASSVPFLGNKPFSIDWYQAGGATPTTPAATTHDIPTNTRAATLHITHNKEQRTVDTLVYEAYTAYQDNHFDVAQNLYKQALQRAPQHRDALLGQAALHQRNTHPQGAIDIYHRLLLRNPRDYTALAGFNTLTQQGDTARYISDLRVLLQQAPDAAPLNYALGNLLSRQQRWAEAQQYFFAAFSQDQENPDIAYNLAVSLDHLGKFAAAADFYHRALDLSNVHASGFDLVQVNQRLRVLEPE